MPIRNEAATIQRALQAVLAQDYAEAGLEIIVADGMSTDGTQDQIKALQSAHANLKLIENQGQFVSTGLNAALRQATGAVVVRVDGHCEISPDYVRQCVQALRESGAHNVGGRMRGIGMTPFGQAVALVTGSPFGVGGGRFHFSNKQEWVDTVYLGAWPRAVFDAIGLWDEELRRDQDDEFNYRLREQGGRILLSPKITSSYMVRSTPGALWRQYYQYGYWKVRVMQKHTRQMQSRQFVPPVFVAALVGAALLGLFSPWGRYLLAGVAGAYLAATAVASLWIARQGGGGLCRLCQWRSPRCT